MKTAKSQVRDNDTAFEDFWAAEKCLKEYTVSVGEELFDPFNRIRLKPLVFEGQHDTAAETIVIGQSESANIRCFPLAYCIMSGQHTYLPSSSSSILSTSYVLDFKNYEQTVYDEIYENERVGKLISSINKFCELYSSQGWDGYDAQPIQRAAYDEAIRFVKMLPSDILLPEPLPEPTGAIAFEWYIKPDRVLVVSFLGNGIMEYAGLFGPDNKSYGSERIGNSIPQVILNHINRILGNELGDCKS